MVFCNEKTNTTSHQSNKVTILILIDGFLQFRNLLSLKMLLTGHNPYFNRWFSAIYSDYWSNKACSGHNPYFNRWFSAIYIHLIIHFIYICHNPYFNRWFSAINMLPTKNR